LRPRYPLFLHRRFSAASPLVPLRSPPLAHAGARGEGRGRRKREECGCDVHNFFTGVL
jgi:hypothetical protein